MHGMGYRDMPLGRGMPPPRDMFFHGGYVEQGIARELRQFRNLPSPLPPLPPVPEYYDNRSLAPGREYYPERMHDRSRDLDYGRERNLDYGYRERGGERGWDRERDYYDDRDSRRDYDNYRDKDYERDRDYTRDRDRDWDRDCRDYERRDRDREPERDRDRDRDWDRQRSSRDDRPKDEPRQKKERISRWDDSYDKEKEKERRRERDREKERDRDHDRGERDRDRDRDRDERERDRDRDRDERERDRDRDRDRERERSRDRDRRSETDDSEFKSENDPTSVIMLRGLRDEIKEDDILQELYDAEVAFKDVRIVRNKIGYTRGFGFVEFEDIESAKQWMNLIKGRLLVQGYSISADYSRPKSNQDKDWNCTKCGTQNFSSRRRTTCFSCGTLKEISTGSEDKESSTSGTPCKVIILKGLDVLTNEENVRTVLSSVTSLPIFDIRLIRDKLTNTSRGFCFVELASVEDATTLLKMLQEMNPPFEIDGRLVCTSYAKTSEPAPTTKPSNVATAAIEQAQWSSSAMQPKQSSAAAMAIAQAQAASQAAYSMPYQQQMPMAVSTSNTTDSSSSSFTSTSTAQASVTSSATQQSALYGNPHASNFVYDPMSGYYYDATSGLYYDSTTQYYYNGTTGQYFYWDGVTQQYVPVTSNGSASTALTTASAVPTVVTAASTVVSITATTTTTETSTTASNEALDSLAAKEKQKKAKSLQAKKIAKDMERWAKNVNAAKAQQHHQPADTLKKPAQIEEPEFKKPTLPPPKLLTVLNKSFMNTADEPQTQEMVRSSPLSGLAAAKEEAAPGKWSSIVAEYGEDDDSDPEPEEPSDNKFADLKLMACLLCKRQFPNKEGLDRHMQFSDLHKQNLEIHKKMSMTEKQLEEYERKEREAKYRDRAKERREKYNQPDIGPSFSQPPSRKRKGFQPTSKFEQPTKEGIGEDNIGNKMLRAMGWSQGSGLGKSGQGIVDPIKAQMRTQYAGLGSAGSSYGSVTGAESPGEKRRKLAMNRYNDL